MLLPIPCLFCFHSKHSSQLLQILLTPEPLCSPSIKLLHVCPLDRKELQDEFQTRSWLFECSPSDLVLDCIPAVPQTEDRQLHGSQAKHSYWLAHDWLFMPSIVHPPAPVSHGAQSTGPLKVSMQKQRSL